MGKVGQATPLETTLFPLACPSSARYSILFMSFFFYYVYSYFPVTL